MPIISIDATFFWQIINFFLLLFIVKKYFKEPISKIMNKRKEKIETELVTATKNREESEHLLKEAETQINSSRKEATEIVKAAQRKADHAGLRYRAPSHARDHGPFAAGKPHRNHSPHGNRCYPA